MNANPKNTQALTCLGDTKLKRNQLEQAASSLEKDISLGTDVRLAYLDMGEVEIQRKRYRAAAKSLSRAVEMDPSQPDAHYRLGRVYQDMGNKDMAQQEFAKTRELHQKQDEAVNLKISVPERK